LKKVGKLKYDVIIAGGGPAGATCAEVLAKQGLDVILFEKAGQKRYKTCAGGLLWHNEIDFGPLPSEIVERNVTNLYLSGPTQTINLKQNGRTSKIGQVTYRTCLDQYLRKCAEKNGARLEFNSEVRDVAIKKDQVIVEVENAAGMKSFYADGVVIAIGIRGTKLHRRLQMDRPTEVEQAINAEFYLPIEVIEERFGGGAYSLFFNSQIAPHGYMWIFTKKEGLSVGICDKFVNLNQFKEILQHYSILSKKLEGAKPLKFDGKHIWAAPIPDRIPEYLYRNRTLLVGDAAGLSDRFTYEGIWHARLSGKFAGETLVKAHTKLDYSATFLQKYQQKCKKIFQTILNSRRMHHLFYHSGLLDIIIDSLIEVLHDPLLREKIINNIQVLLEGFVTPGDKAAKLNVILQQKLIETLKKKYDRKIVRQLNHELEFAFALE